MNTSFLNIPNEIKKIVQQLQIPIDGLNFMPGERQAELRYKNKTIGYIICFDEGNVMHYKTSDALTQKHLDWHFVYRQNQKIIDQKVLEAVGDKSAVISPAAFRRLQVKSTTDSSTLTYECKFDGNEWQVSAN
ncbi:hypothetical protein BH10BAC4_BH10BAC4_26910 [soil metagenome]